MLSARWEANDNKLQCKLTLWIGKHVFFKYFTVKLHVNLIRDIDTLERYSKDFKSITKFGELLLLASRDPRKAKMQWVCMERGRGTRARVSPCPTRPRRLRFLPSAFHSPLSALTPLSALRSPRYLKAVWNHLKEQSDRLGHPLLLNHASVPRRDLAIGRAWGGESGKLTDSLWLLLADGRGCVE